MKHVYLTTEKIEQAYKARSITKKEAIELEEGMKRSSAKVSKQRKLAS